MPWHLSASLFDCEFIVVVSTNFLVISYVLWILFLFLPIALASLFGSMQCSLKLHTHSHIYRMELFRNFLCLPFLQWEQILVKFLSGKSVTGRELLQEILKPGTLELAQLHFRYNFSIEQSIILLIGY